MDELMNEYLKDKAAKYEGVPVITPSGDPTLTGTNAQAPAAGQVSTPPHAPSHGLPPEQAERITAHTQMLAGLLEAHKLPSTFTNRIICDIGYRAGIEATTKAIGEAYAAMIAEDQTIKEREPRKSRWMQRLEQMRDEQAAQRRKT